MVDLLSKYRIKVGHFSADVALSRRHLPALPILYVICVNLAPLDAYDTCTARAGNARSIRRIEKSLGNMSVPDLRALLDLEPNGEGRWRSASPDTNAGGEVFGGQYLGLAVHAAMLTAPGRSPHALSSFFLRRAEASSPVDYQVEQTRDGAAFAHRRVTASQFGKEVFRAEISFHEAEADQPSHQIVSPTAPDISTLKSHHQCVLDRADDLDPLVVRRVISRASFQSYFPDPEEGLGKPGSRPYTLAWLEPSPPPAAGDAIGYYATLAYLTDACANFAARIMHAAQLHDGELASSSLNHAIWFHSTPRPIGRVLYEVDSPYSGHGLGFNRGTMFDINGHVLASITQEALIRRQRLPQKYTRSVI
jgi:acyl-CoA thioesterase-2